MGTSMTAVLVAPEDAGARPEGLVTAIGRDQIEEALASDAPLDLILDVARPGETRTTGITVTWRREDLEELVSRFESDIMLAFDPAALDRALDDDFEGHGIRELALLTVAAASASAALAASTASGQLLDAGGGGGASASVVAPGHGEAATARDLAAPQAVDSGSGFELPSVDTGTAAAIGGLAGAGLLIVGAGFAARRQRTGTA